MAAQPGEVVAGYTVESVLGTGGMGSVYRVRHRTLPRSIALKVLHEQFSSSDSVRARFDREADLVAGLKHPGIVDVYDRGESDGHLWIAMALVDGENLSTVLQREGRFSLDRTVDIVDQVADALDYAHSHGVLHRDVKPANFLVERGRRGDHVLLADFGIGAAQQEVGQHTETGMVVGTLAYTAPEALLGQPVDSRADVYSLACSAVVMLTGAPPFDTTVTGALMLAHINQMPPSIRLKRPDLSPEVDYVLQRALAKNPADRFQTAGEFASALSAAARRMSGASGMAPPPPAPPNWQGSPSNPAQHTGFRPGGPGGPSSPGIGGPSRPSNPSVPGYTAIGFGQSNPSQPDFRTGLAQPVPVQRRTPKFIAAGAAAGLVLVLAIVGAVMLLHKGSSYAGPALDSWKDVSITDVNGTTDLTARPQRIVALGSGDAEMVEALGLKVLGAANGSNAGAPSWLPDAGSIGKVGTASSPDRSAIAALKPDLILLTDISAKSQASDLKSVAPTISRPQEFSSGWSWKQQIEFIAKALGATARAQQVESDYDAKVGQLRGQYSSFSSVKADLVQYTGSDTLLATNSSSPYQLLNSLGFSMQTPVDGSGAWITVGSSDIYNVVSNDKVDKTFVARTDSGASAGGYAGLPDSLTSGVPVSIVDSSSGVDALLTGGPLALDTVVEKVLPKLK
ncbi:serine/threonine-protein kinase [Tsukamurella sp. 8F]|uniref:serine/threonine-protein kinase n=1 Tax=unclassified Tsukamurella TaxID=2633480 RepID=UPI0023B97C99|nr:MULTISPECIES: serine/threonine-protein kinase [unclassified Tsukamurella]MDF0531483.1 serine/threonine-protein kinase [Tsukamurella sp. 8J]MDF0588727.1 serine/threonine-protein kinase [Tsukamurella sp. 8F]